MNKLKFLIVILILFLTVYFPPFKFLKLSPEYILIFLGVIWSCLNFKKFSRAILTKPIFVFFCTQIFIILYSIVIDFSFQKAQHFPLEKLYYFKQLRFLINSIFISLVISTYLNYKKWSVDKLINGFVIIGVIQSFISTLMLVSPSLKTVILNMMNLDFLSESKEGIMIFRIFGVSSEYLFTYPIFQGFVLMIIFLQVMEKRYKYVPFVPFILLSIIFNARIGLVAIPIVIFVYLIFILYQKNKIYFMLNYSKILLFMVFFAAISIFIGVKIVGIEIFELIFLRGVESNSSGGHLDALFNKMVFLPSSIFGYFFGEGRYLFGNRYDVQSDIGYFNDLLFGGLIYIIIYIRNWKNLMFKNVKSNSNSYYLLIIASFLLILASNYKGPLFANNGFLRALLILIFLNLLNKKHESKAVSVDNNSIL